MFRSPFRSFAMAAALAVPAAGQDAKGKVDFAAKIWPILEKNCLECHRTAFTDENGRLKKPKGGVVLDSKEGITTSKKGKLIVAKQPAESMLYASITLPADDEDRMPPPKKGPPLSKEHQELIKTWIEEGANFGKWTGAAKEADPKGDKNSDKGGSQQGDGKQGGGQKGDGKQADYRALARGLTPLEPQQLADFASGPWHITSLGDDSPLLVVVCAAGAPEVGDRALDALLPLAERIVELDLGRTGISDAAAERIARMPRLVALDLRQTGVGDRAIAALSGLRELRVLNLFGTRIGDYGLAVLGKLPQLRELYLWQTNTSAAAVVRLREQLPGLRVVMAADLPEPMGETTRPRPRR